jgi:hypothetical protein
MNVQQRSRKVSTLARLEDQLKSGVKTSKGQTDVQEPLVEKDIKRIEKEILTLKTKLKN